MNITAKELVALVSERMNVPIETVTVMDRRLAEAGLRTRSLRGRGKTFMNHRDAANLIVATAILAPVRDTVSVVTQKADICRKVAWSIQSMDCRPVLMSFRRSAFCVVNIVLEPCSIMAGWETLNESR